jgi:hypothetical protein
MTLPCSTATCAAQGSESSAPELGRRYVPLAAKRAREVGVIREATLLCNARERQHGASEQLGGVIHTEPPNELTDGHTVSPTKGAGKHHGVHAGRSRGVLGSH